MFMTSTNKKQILVYLTRFILIAICGLLFYSQIIQIQLVQNSNDSSDVSISDFDKVVIFISFILPVCSLLLVLVLLPKLIKAFNRLKILIAILIINIILAIPSLVNIYKLIVDYDKTVNKYLQVITQIYSILNILLILFIIIFGWVFINMFAMQ